MSNNFSANYQVQKVNSILTIFLLLSLSSGVLAQKIILDQQDLLDHYESPCYNDHISFFPSIACTDNITGHFNVLPLYTNTVYNSEYARGLNDGPAWQGKGGNFTTAFGFSGRWGNLTYVVNPIIQYNQNLPFNTGVQYTSRGNPYQYPFDDRIDYVMRYGSSSSSNIYPGQSELALSLNKIEFSVSTQNMRWGPAVYNPIIMSTNAEGFPHLRIGTNNLLETKIGEFEGHILWGILRESDYFNNNSEDNNRYFTGLTLGYKPSFLEGFSFTAQRTLYTQTQYLTGFIDNGLAAFSGLFHPDGGTKINGEQFANDIYDQNMSISIEYNSVDENLLIFWEWAVGDFSAGISNFLEHPDHFSGFTIGLSKTFVLANSNRLLLLIEHSDLETWSERFTAGLGAISFYEHGLNQQGYTNNGQIMGASIGPGSNSDEIRLAYLWDKSSITFEYQRTRFDDDYFFTQVVKNDKQRPWDAEHQVGFQYTSNQFRKVTFNAAFFTGIRNNYLYQDPILKVNIHTKFAFRYHF
ncbi:capsule assembly Wzi family protein [Gracilimonas sp.]|uniref:capsule assembly Wzi family protein n=1 Tax=Gracilimonas sp. TaxID=1974203 RepID=UPI003BA9B887